MNSVMNLLRKSGTTVFKMNVERSSTILMKTTFMMKDRSNVQTLKYVKLVLYHNDGLALKETEIDEVCLAILKQNNIERKHLKKLLSDRILTIGFTHSQKKDELW